MELRLGSFDSWKVSFQEHVNEPNGTYQGYIHTENGFALKECVPTEITVLDWYMRRGNWKVYNVLMDGKKRIMSDPDGGREVTVFDRSHYSDAVEEG